MKPHQYFLMIAAIIFGYYAVNFLISYLESHYNVVRIEEKIEDVEKEKAISLPTKHTYLTTEPEQRAPITGHKSLYELEEETGCHNMVIGYEAGYVKNQ